MHKLRVYLRGGEATLQDQKVLSLGLVELDQHRRSRQVLTLVEDSIKVPEGELIDVVGLDQRELGC